MRSLYLIPALLLFALPTTLLAHEGHGAFAGHELAHYLASPAHVLPVLAGLAIGAFFLFRYARRRSSE